MRKLRVPDDYDDIPLPPEPDDDEHESVGEGWRPHIVRDEDAPVTNEPDDEPEVDSWAPFDLGPYLRGEITPPEPGVGLHRTDGLPMLYAGREHSIIGETECGKSWWMLACAVAEMRAGHTVGYVHFEECDPSSTIERLRALGLDTTTIGRLLRFHAPTTPALTDSVTDHVLAPPVPSLVLLDGVTEGMVLHGLNPMDNMDCAAFRRRVVTRCSAAGAATLQADHVTKSLEGRGRNAIGGVHKINGLTGVQISLENAEPFGRKRRGRSHVYVQKDRPGYLRAHGEPDPNTPGKTFMGEFVIDDTQAHLPDLEMHFWAPNPAGRHDDDPAAVELEKRHLVADEVHAALVLIDEQSVPSQKQLEAAVRSAGYSHRATAVRDAAEDLVLAGRLVKIPGKNGGTGYQVVVRPDSTSSQDQSE